MAELGHNFINVENYKEKMNNTASNSYEDHSNAENPGNSF